MLKSKIWKISKWILGLIGIYFFCTLLYFGYSEVDEKKGVYTYYWSGIQALFNNTEFGISDNKYLDTKFDGLDGPYISDGFRYDVSAQNKLIKTPISPGEEFIVAVGNKAVPGFKVKLRNNYATADHIYKRPEKLIAISDIEGNFIGFYSFLISNKVIDQQGNWIYGKGHLVLNGDFVDRGNQVTQVLWLIYKLEQQAETARGKVHYILGNHEIMMLQGNVSYANFKYIEAAKRISGVKFWDQATRSLYAENTELGTWLRSKNIVERIGENLFVHAGMNIRHVNENLDIKKLNQIAKANYGKPYTNNFINATEEMTLSGIYAPYWDRSLAMDFKNKMLYFLNNVKAKETTQLDLEKICRYYQVSRIIIGHSIVNDIRTDYDGKVIKIDVHHGTSMRSGKTKGIILQGNRAIKVDDAI